MDNDFYPVHPVKHKGASWYVEYAAEVLNHPIFLYPRFLKSNKFYIYKIEKGNRNTYCVIEN